MLSKDNENTRKKKDLEERKSVKYSRKVVKYGYKTDEKEVKFFRKNCQISKFCAIFLPGSVILKALSIITPRIDALQPLN